MSNWDGWSSLGGALAGGQPAVAQNADGRLEIFAQAAGAQGPELHHAWQTSPNGGWSAWSSLGAPPGDFLGASAVARNADGRLEAFARVGLMSTGSLWHSWQTAPGGGWSAWDDLGGNVGGHILAAAQNQDGRLEVFAVSSTGTLQHIWQTNPGGVWSAWGDLGSPMPLTAGITAGQNLDGRLEVFAAATDGSVWHLWQDAPNSGWSAWSSLGSPGGPVSEPVVGRNQDGRLELFAVSQNQLWHRWQTSAGGSWDSWASLGAPPATASIRAPAVAQNSDGRLEVFLGSPGQATWHIWQTSPNSGWSAWDSLAGRPGAGPAVGQNADGRLEVFVEDGASSGPHAAWHRWQLSSGGAWSSAAIDWVTNGPADAVSALAVTPAGALLAAGASGVWCSNDGGGSWAKISATLLGETLSVASGSGTLWGVSADATQMLSSADGGHTWTARYTTSGGASINSVLADPNAPGTVWAGMTAPDSLAEVVRSTDGGATWTAVLPASLRGAGGLSPTAAGPLAGSPGIIGLLLAGARYYHGGGVLRTLDGGATWTLAYDDNLTPLAGASSVAVHGSSLATARVFAGLNVLQFGSLVRSDDGGSTWTDVSAHLPVHDPSAGGVVANIVIDPLQPATLYVSMWNTSSPQRTGVFVSSDGGQSWSEVGHLGPRVAGPGGLLLKPDTYSLYAATSQGVYSYPL
jgi:hypothetical protein